MEKALKEWREAQGQIRRLIGDLDYGSYVQHLRPVSDDGQQVVLETKYASIAAHAQEYLQDPLQQCLRRRVKVRFNPNTAPLVSSGTAANRKGTPERKG